MLNPSRSSIRACSRARPSPSEPLGVGTDCAPRQRHCSCGSSFLCIDPTRCVSPQPAVQPAACAQPSHTSGQSTVHYTAPARGRYPPSPADAAMLPPTVCGRVSEGEHVLQHGDLSKQVPLHPLPLPASTQTPAAQAPSESTLSSTQPVRRTHSNATTAPAGCAVPYNARLWVRFPPAPSSSTRQRASLDPIPAGQTRLEIRSEKELRSEKSGDRDSS